MVAKSQIILYMYDMLINNNKIIMDEVIALFGISIRTFRRYISEINSFLYNNYKNQQKKYDNVNHYYKISSR